MMFLAQTPITYNAVSTFIGVLGVAVGSIIAIIGFFSGRDKKVASDAAWKTGIAKDLKSILDSTSTISQEVCTIKDKVAEHTIQLNNTQKDVGEVFRRLDRIENNSTKAS